jgi:hypothetical protein
MGPLAWVRVCVVAVEIAGVGVELRYEFEAWMVEGLVPRCCPRSGNLDFLVFSIRVVSSPNRPFLEVYALIDDIVKYRVLVDVAIDVARIDDLSIFKVVY